ncbi:MAG: hypothetical protein WC125_11715 [Bacteroidales bacterium]
MSMFFLVLATTNKTFAQTKEQAAEISSEVPELQAFHKIIYPLWHKAYPAKDYAAIKGFVPQIKAHMEKMNSAKLSGILRDKENQWKEQLVKFNAVAEAYYKACAENNEAAMLKAAEDFHTGYEAMNRVVKPFTPEIDTYHQTLYVIYHKLLPENNFKGISELMDKFIAQAQAISKTPEEQIAKRLKDRVPKFYTVSKELYDNTVALQKILNKGSEKMKAQAVETVHSSYEKLESVFE